MQIPKTTPPSNEYKFYADTNHYKILLHYKQMSGDHIDGPACACSPEWAKGDTEGKRIKFSLRRWRMVSLRPSAINLILRGTTSLNRLYIFHVKEKNPETLKI